MKWEHLDILLGYAIFLFVSILQIILKYRKKCGFLSIFVSKDARIPDGIGLLEPVKARKAPYRVNYNHKYNESLFTVVKQKTTRGLNFWGQLSEEKGPIKFK